MTEVKAISGNVLFTYDESETTLKREIVKHKFLVCADLTFANLSGADLTGADLTGADLSGANLRGANFRRAELIGADLFNANIRDADLRNANLSEARLRCADLTGADLSGADIRWANLRWANLKGANLSGAYIINASISDADLMDANLIGANLYNTDLSDVKNMPDLPMACPSEGSFIAWKKVNGQFLIKLEIPEDAKRSSATSKKCRCNKAKVLEIIDFKTGENVDKVVNIAYISCTYTVGGMVYPDWFDNNRWNELLEVVVR